MKKMWFIGLTILVLISGKSYSQYVVKIEPDSIMAGEGDATISVLTDKKDLNLSCIARRGGGSFTDFKVVQTSAGTVNQAIFRSPFPGETEIEVMDTKFNKVGKCVVTVIAPIIQILEQESLDKINWKDKSMPLMVKVTDPHGNAVRSAKLVCKLTEIINKKFVATATKASEFTFMEDHYEATISGLKDASYRVEVTDMGHLESHDKAEDPDNPHPSVIIEGLNISF